MARVSALLLVGLCVVTAHVGTRANEEPERVGRLSAIEVILDERGVVVTFAANGRLEPSSIQEAEQWPPRLVIDLPDVTPGVPGSTRVDVGPVAGIRVAAHSQNPPVTRVVFDLLSPTSYEIDQWAGSTERLMVIFPLAAEKVEKSSEVSHTDVDRFAGGLPWGRSLGSGVQVVPAKAVVTSSPSSGRFASFPPRQPVTYREVPLATGTVVQPFGRWLGDERLLSKTILGTLSPQRLTVVPSWSREAWGGVPAPVDDIDLIGHQWLEIGRLVDPESLSIPAYLVLGNRGAAGTEPERSRSGQASSRLIRPSPTPISQSTQLQRVAPGEPRQYTGDPVSMDFQNAPLRAVLRTLAEISGLNIVIDPQVDGSVDVALTDVPWDQTLDIILRANQLGYIVDGTVVRIAPLSVLANEEEQRRLLAEAQADSGELVVMTRTLSYARAENMGDLITQSVLSRRGQVQTDQRTNTVIVTDLEDRLRAVDELLDTLDRAEPQVEIEARIVQAGKDFARSIGVNWGLTGRVAPELGNTTSLTFPNRGGVSGRVGQQGPGVGEQPGDPRASEIEAVGTAVNLPAAAASSALGLTMGAVDGALNLDVVISAAEGDGQIRLLSHPRVTTLNNVTAEIIQGDQIPIQIVSNNTVTVQFEDAALILRVTPQIAEDDSVIMQIEIDNDFADFGREINGIPPIVTQRASTTVRVANGDTTVIGGIFESESSRQDNRVPLLHRIPLLGWLFKSQAERESTEELLIFLTPRVVR